MDSGAIPVDSSGMDPFLQQDALSIRGMGGQGCADSSELAQPQTDEDSDDVMCHYCPMILHCCHHVP